MSSKLLIASLFVANSAVSAGLSYYAYTRAIDLPAAPQVALVDVEAIVHSVNADEPNSKDIAKKKVDLVKEKARQLASLGVIVLDASNVIEAPDEAYINLRTDDDRTVSKEEK